MADLRVRGVLVTDDDRVLTIKRIKQGSPSYWVLPGGGVEATDPDPESALQRELNEELAGRAEISRLIHVVERVGVRELIYVGRALDWAFDRRSGPEFAESDRGSYELELVPLSSEGLAGINLKPDSVADMLQRAARVGQSPLDLPDLR